MNAAQVDLRFAMARLPEPTPCADDPRFTDEDPAVRIEAARLCRTCPLLSLCQEAGRGEKAGIWGGLDRGPAPEPTKPIRKAPVKTCTECGVTLPPRRRVVCSDECYSARYHRLYQKGTAMSATYDPDDRLTARATIAAIDGDVTAYAAVMREVPDQHRGVFMFSLLVGLASQLPDDTADSMRAILLDAAMEES